MQDGRGFAFGFFWFFEELRVYRFDNLCERDLGWIRSEEIAAAFSAFGNDEIGLFEVREDLH